MHKKIKPIPKTHFGLSRSFLDEFNRRAYRAKIAPDIRNPPVEVFGDSIDDIVFYINSILKEIDYSYFMRKRMKELKELW